MKILTELGEKIDEYSENFNNELENIKKTSSEVKNSTSEIEKQTNKQTKQKKWNSRLDDTEEYINYLESKIMKINQHSNEKRKF